LLHPVLEDLDLLGGQFARRRHVRVVAVSHRLHEQALVGLAGNDRGAVVTALQEGRPRRDFKPALRFGVPVTPSALLDQEGADVRLEILIGSVSRRFRRLGGKSRQAEKKHQPAPE